MYARTSEFRIRKVQEEPGLRDAMAAGSQNHRGGDCGSGLCWVVLTMSIVGVYPSSSDSVAIEDDDDTALSDTTAATIFKECIFSSSTLRRTSPFQSTGNHLFDPEGQQGEREGPLGDSACFRLATIDIWPL